MKILIQKDLTEIGQQAAAMVGDTLSKAVATRGSASLVLATGMSQLTFLENLTARKDVNWSKVTAFHLDEYIGIDAAHPAGFANYVNERFVSKLPHPLAAFHAIQGMANNPDAECSRLGALITAANPDMVCLGVAENGHLAFNDPPADFVTGNPFIQVSLNEETRRQQFNQGWFKNLSEVPSRAISMSVRQILRGTRLLCIAAGEKKAETVRNAIEGSLTPDCPMSALRLHPCCTLLLDGAAAAKLSAIARG